MFRSNGRHKKIAVDINEKYKKVFAYNDVSKNNGRFKDTLKKVLGPDFNNSVMEALRRETTN